LGRRGGVDLDLARTAAGKYKLPTSLLAGVWDFESGGNPGAINKSSGATGLGQVMPRERGFPDRPTQQELLDPATNAEWSARILKAGLDRYGDEDKALAAYLGAIDARGNITGAVDANGTGGNQYIRTVRERQRKYADADGSSDRSVSAPAAATDDDPEWYRLFVQQQGVRPTTQSASRGEGREDTGEVWPVVGQKWGAVNNPFGGNQARSAGATVALPDRNVGADLTAKYNAEVVAPVSGTVVEVFDAPNETDRNANRGWGGMTLLRGDNGYFYRLSHAKPGSVAARPGQRVNQGDYLQRVGVSGNTTGAHLDYEKFAAPGQFVDPVATRGSTVSSAQGAPSGEDPAWYRQFMAQQGR
jgi:murein DD-endopeptidase MepM/ murein hydrolase activator NlpD